MPPPSVPTAVVTPFQSFVQAGSVGDDCPYQQADDSPPHSPAVNTQNDEDSEEDELDKFMAGVEVRSIAYDILIIILTCY